MANAAVDGARCAPAVRAKKNMGTSGAQARCLGNDAEQPGEEQAAEGGGGGDQGGHGAGVGAPPLQGERHHGGEDAGLGKARSRIGSGGERSRRNDRTSEGGEERGAAHPRQQPLRTEAVGGVGHQ